jgi:hypothetical protein
MTRTKHSFCINVNHHPNEFRVEQLNTWRRYSCDCSRDASEPWKIQELKNVIIILHLLVEFYFYYCWTIGLVRIFTSTLELGDFEICELHFLRFWCTSVVDDSLHNFKTLIWMTFTRMPLIGRATRMLKIFVFSGFVKDKGIVQNCLKSSFIIALRISNTHYLPLFFMNTSERISYDN